MDWIQFALFFLAVGGMFFSMRSDARDDRHRSADDRKDIVHLLRSSQQENRQVTESIRDEIRVIREDIKDFHGRLCALEEKYLQVITRKSNG